jgi:hypothetical protein
MPTSRLATLAVLGLLIGCNAGSANVKDRVAAERAATKASSAKMLAGTTACCTDLPSTLDQRRGPTLEKAWTGPHHVFIGRGDPVLEIDGERSFFKRFEIPAPGVTVVISTAGDRMYRPPGHRRGGLFCPVAYVLDEAGKLSRRIRITDAEGAFGPDIAFIARDGERHVVVATLNELTSHDRAIDRTTYWPVMGVAGAAILPSDVLCNWEGFVTIGYRGETEPDS